MDVSSLMHRTVTNWPDREAVATRTRTLTFAEAWSRGLRLAGVLRELGVEPGDRVAVLEDNCIESADFLLGCTAANYARVPLYARSSRSGHAHILANTDARVLVVSERYARNVAGLDDELPTLEHIIVRDSSYESLLDDAEALQPLPTALPDDVYIIRHTAGTTGVPKGIAITNRQWLSSERDWFYSFPPLELGDTCLHSGPISHGSGYFFMPPWLAGGRNILLERFDPEEVLDVMERERVALTFMVPTMLAQLVAQASARGRDWTNLKAISIAGAPSSERTLRLAREIFGEVIYQAYGQSEVFPATTIGPRELYAEIPGSNPLRSAGRAFPFAELMIRDQNTGQPLGPGQEGEIAVRTDGQMTAYWNDPEATKEKVVAGWVLTGDVGRLDEHGYLYVLDRAADMIISGGFNIWPAELENVIAAHPAVLEVAVFGIPDERWGETPAAVCVASSVDAIDETEIIDLCKSRLGAYKKPSKVIVTTEPLPKNLAGKVLRRVLREPYWRGHEKRVAGS